MSGGISAIKGFDYQATIVLDRLFDHFDQHAPSAKVRPEGILSWNAGTAEHRRYEQIKKPTEDRDGNLNGFVRHDLFAEKQDDGFVTDPELLRKLAAEKLQKAAARLKEDGHAWVEVIPHVMVMTYWPK